MLEVLNALKNKIQELVIEVDEFENIHISGYVQDAEEPFSIEANNFDAAFSQLIAINPDFFAGVANLIRGNPSDQSICLEPISEIGIDHPLFSEIRFDLDRCIRRGIDAASDDIVATVPLKIQIKQNPYSRAAQVSHSISLNVTQKKHASKGKIKDFNARYDESGHLIVFDEQITLEDLSIEDPDDDEKIDTEIETETASEPESINPFDEVSNEQPQASKCGGLVSDIWKSLAVGSEVRIMNQTADVTGTVSGFTDIDTKAGKEWVIKLTSENGEEENIQEKLVDILVWCDRWYYRELPESEKPLKQINLLDGLEEAIT